MAGPQTDEELLQAWAEGNSGSGEVLFERHFDSVARFFRNKATSGHEDLIQATFLGCLESRAKFRGDSSFRSYLFGIARNTLRQHYRSSRKELEQDFRDISVAEMGASPSQILVADQDQQLLLHALRRIPLDYQIALELHYWESLSATEIAVSLGLPLGTAKTRIRRAKQLLAAELQEVSAGRISMQVTGTRLETWARGLRAQLFPRPS